MLSPELNTYFDMLEETFGTPGWAVLVEEAEKQIYALQADALEAKSWEDLLILRGRAFQLQDLINMRDAATVARKLAEEDATAVAEVADASV